MIYAIARLNISAILPVESLRVERSILIEKTERSDTTNLQSSIPGNFGDALYIYSFSNVE